jgi:hypothetical protein
MAVGATLSALRDSGPKDAAKAAESETEDR